jgi:hypothetical protein
MGGRGLGLRSDPSCPAERQSSTVPRLCLLVRLRCRGVRSSLRAAQLTESTQLPLATGLTIVVQRTESRI